MRNRRLPTKPKASPKKPAAAPPEPPPLQIIYEGRDFPFPKFKGPVEKGLDRDPES